MVIIMKDGGKSQNIHLGMATSQKLITCVSGRTYDLYKSDVYRLRAKLCNFSYKGLASLKMKIATQLRRPN